MASKKLPSILRRAIDPNGDIDAQCLARFKAVFAYCGVPWESEKAERRVLVALMLEQFGKAFKVQAPPADPRRKVEDVADLITIVEAITSSAVDKLADAYLRELGQRVRNWLNYRGLRVTKTNVCVAISRVDKGRWKGVNPHTLRDNVYRPPGNFPRRKREEEQERRVAREKIYAGLKRCRDAIGPSSDDEPMDD